MRTKKKLADLEERVQSLQEKYEDLVSRLNSGYDFARCMAKEQAAMLCGEGVHLLDRQKSGPYCGTKEQENAKDLLRESIRKGREKHGLSTDIAELIEKYRKLDPQYAEELGRLTGISPASMEKEFVRLIVPAEDVQTVLRTADEGDSKKRNDRKVHVSSLNQAQQQVQATFQKRLRQPFQQRQQSHMFHQKTAKQNRH